MFIVSPRIGLCNQLQTIVKGILLSIKYNRNLYIDQFQIDLYNTKLCDINDILNISKINDYLHNIKGENIKIKILEKIDKNIIDNISNHFLPNLNYDKISTMDYINEYIEENIDKNIIYLGNIVSLDIYRSFNYNWNDYNNLYHLIMSNITFNDKFYILKDDIKSQLNLKNYTSIHLRIEDDALKHFSFCNKLSINEYNDKLLDFYNNAIKKQTQLIYICSGILTFDNNINYNYYVNLMKNNKLLCDKKNIHIDSYYLNNRELIAILDLLISFDSINFIGSGISSFTQVIKTYFKCKKEIDCEIY